jgi:hypothetical protein
MDEENKSKLFEASWKYKILYTELHSDGLEESN